jgi:hypothetical protein
MQAAAPTARDLIVVEHVSPALIMNTMTKEILPKLCVVIAPMHTSTSSPPCTRPRHRPHARIHARFHTQMHHIA